MCSHFTPLDVTIVIVPCPSGVSPLRVKAYDETAEVADLEVHLDQWLLVDIMLLFKPVSNMFSCFPSFRLSLVLTK